MNKFEKDSKLKESKFEKLNEENLSRIVGGKGKKVKKPVVIKPPTNPIPLPTGPFPCPCDNA